MFDQLQEIQDEICALQESERGLMAKNIILLDRLAKAEKEAISARESALKYENTASKVMALTNQIARLTYSAESLELEKKTLSEELAKLKAGDNPKKLKDQIKRVKDKNNELTKSNGQLKRDNKDYRSEIKELKTVVNRINARLTECGYLFKSIDEYQLMVFPAVMGVERNGVMEHIITLLCFGPEGVGVRLTVQDGELFYPDAYKHFENQCEKIPASVRDFARDWLSKIESQGYRYSEADLLNFGDADDIEQVKKRERFRK